MTESLAVTGGRIVTESAVFDATVLVGEDGRITALMDPSVPVVAAETVDASGMLVFPGGIDTHSHLNDPGLTESEDFHTGTSGAAAGGYTTVLEMPQTLPLVDSVETFRDKLETVGPKAVVDFGLYGALVPGNAGDKATLDAMGAEGAIAFKGFICDTPEMPTLTPADLTEGMRNARALGPVAVHCESQPVLDREIERAKRAGADDVGAVADAHPLEAEEEAVRVVLDATREAEGRLHLVHMSDPLTVQLGTAAKVAGVDVSIETCPHYLALTRGVLETSSGWGLCFPPFRTEAAVEGLWRALELGMIDSIGSDHCAYKLEEKTSPDPWEVLPGINGIQVALPVLVDGAVRRGISLSAVARAFSGNPARRYSLHPRKGGIHPGADADLVLVDINNPMTVHAKDFFTRCPGTVYEGMTFGARIRRTLVRGTTVYVGDETPRITVEPGFGAFLNGDVARATQGAELTRRVAGTVPS